MRKFQFFFSLVITICLFAGCAEMDIPSPQKLVRNPIGAESVKIGMSKNQVLSIYNEPDFKSIVVSDVFSGEREEWFYKARIGVFPVNADYLSEDLYLYFDEGSLAKISNQPIGKSKK